MLNEMKMFKYILCVVLSNFICSISLANAIPTEARFQTIEKLLTVSTAAKRIEASDNDSAKDKLESAIALFNQAKIAVDNGNGAQAESLLGEAASIMFTATRMVKKDKSFAQKDLRDFDTRLASIDALCVAYDNIRKEKGLGPAEGSELYPFVQKRLSHAKELKQQSRLKEGRKVLDEAYVAAKVAIEHLRGGETLVRSLNFETVEDEYHYEVDRNDTHRMLVDVLLNDKIDSSASINAMVDKFMVKAKDLRTKADGQASDGEYEAAITTLEQSTKEIVRAIRSAGIYIPG